MAASQAFVHVSNAGHGRPTVHATVYAIYGRAGVRACRNVFDIDHLPVDVERHVDERHDGD